MIRLPFSTFDPLSNRRTSQVLFLMIRGVDTPTTIANELNVKPPAVMDQLHKLRKARVVQPGEKTGKDQHYAIDWDRLAKESIRRTVAPHYGPGVYTDTHAAEFVKEFPRFALFLRSYFETFLSTCDDVKGELLAYPTFSEQLGVLHSTLIAQLDDVFRYLLIDESSVRQVSESLREWIRTSHPSNPWDVELVEKTLTKLGFKATTSNP